MLAPQRNLAIILAVLPLTGCSTHPLPEDVTRKTTFQIVERLRCEARAGIEQTGITDVTILRDTYVGFDFDLTMLETDKAAGGKLTLLNPINGGSVKFDITGNAEKIRQNQRHFRVIDSFQKLLDYKKCKEPDRKNIIYPISGHVGLDEVVTTYWNLHNLTTYTADVKENIFSDEITFTTTLGAGFAPTIDINSNVGGLKLTDATIAGSVERKDTHKVVMAIASKGSGYAADARALFIEDESPGIDSSASGVIFELNRIRNRNDRVKALEPLGIIP